MRRFLGDGRLRGVALIPLTLLLGMAVVGLGLVGLRALDRTGAFDVQRVAVEGAAKGAGPVRDVALETIGPASMLTVDPAHVEQAIAALPQVRTVEVDRAFPATLRVRVVPERPVALAPSGRGVVALAASGRVLGVPTKGQAGLPVIAAAPADLPGAGGTVTASAVLDQLALAATPQRRLRLEAIGYGADGLVARIAGGGEVRIGDARDLPVKLKVARTVIRRAGGSFAYVDVTVPSAPVLRMDTADALTVNAPALNPSALPPVGDLGEWVAGAAPAESIRTIFG